MANDSDAFSVSLLRISDRRSFAAMVRLCRRKRIYSLRRMARAGAPSPPAIFSGKQTSSYVPGLDVRKVQSFDHPDPCSKDNSVRFKPFVSIRSDGQIVDTDGPDAAFNQIAGSISAERDIVLQKVAALRPVE